MASNVLIGNWSTGLWQQIGSPSSVSALAISGYAVQPQTLGTLNARIGTCYSGSGFMGTGVIFDTSPDVSNAELAIVGAMYQVSFYSQLVLATMGQGGSTIPFSSLAEGDSRIGLVNAATIGKEYREAAKDATAQLNYLINAYIQTVQNGSIPRDVAFFNPGSAYTNSPYGNGAGVSYGAA